jgi:hypothetical protein
MSSLLRLLARRPNSTYHVRRFGTNSLAALSWQGVEQLPLAMTNFPDLRVEHSNVRHTDLKTHTSCFINDDDDDTRNFQDISQRWFLHLHPASSHDPHLSHPNIRFLLHPAVNSSLQ